MSRNGNIQRRPSGSVGSGSFGSKSSPKDDSVTAMYDGSLCGTWTLKRKGSDYVPGMVYGILILF